MKLKNKRLIKDIFLTAITIVVFVAIGIFLIEIIRDLLFPCAWCGQFDLSCK